MKKLVTAIGLALGMMSMVGDVSAKVNININIQPNWGPSGYNYASFYYLPEYNVYYDISSRMFFYQSASRWVSAAQLPRQFGHVDLYRTYKVVVNEAKPYKFNDKHLRAYSAYKFNYKQQNIRDYQLRNKGNTPNKGNVAVKPGKPNDQRNGVNNNQGPKGNSTAGTTTQGGPRR